MWQHLWPEWIWLISPFYVKAKWKLCIYILFLFTLWDTQKTLPDVFRFCLWSVVSSVYFQLMADQISLVHNFKKMLLSNWVSSQISVPQQPCIVTSLIQVTLSQNFHIRVGNRSPNHKQTAPEIIHLDTNHFNYLPSWKSLKRNARQRYMMCEAYGEDLLTIGVVFSLCWLMDKTKVQQSYSTLRTHFGPSVKNRVKASDWSSEVLRHWSIHELFQLDGRGLSKPLVAGPGPLQHPDSHIVQLKLMAYLWVWFRIMPLYLFYCTSAHSCDKAGFCSFFDWIVHKISWLW